MANARDVLFPDLGALQAVQFLLAHQPHEVFGAYARVDVGQVPVQGHHAVVVVLLRLAVRERAGRGATSLYCTEGGGGSLPFWMNIALYWMNIALYWMNIALYWIL